MVNAIIIKMANNNTSNNVGSKSSRIPSNTQKGIINGAQKARMDLNQIGGLYL
jgi:hypothetical protein